MYQQAPDYITKEPNNSGKGSGKVASGKVASAFTTSTCSTSKESVGSSFWILLRLYIVMQYLILLGSLCILIILRVYYNYFIQDIKSKWDTKCFNSFTLLSGVMYAVSTLGIVEFFLYKDAIKRLAEKAISIRAKLKITIEVVSVLYFIADSVIVFGIGIFNSCDDNLHGEDNVKKAKDVLKIALIAYGANLLSFILYIQLRKIVLSSEGAKLFFDNFIRPKWT